MTTRRSPWPIWSRNGHCRRLEAPHPRHPGAVGGIGAGAMVRAARAGANCGWSIRSTAPANSSSATANSPSTSRWSSITSRCWASSRRRPQASVLGRCRRRGVQPAAGGAAQIQVAAPAPQPLRVVGSRSHVSAETAAYLERLGPHDHDRHRQLAEILPAWPKVRPISILASGRRRNGIRRPARRCSRRPAAMSLVSTATACATTAAKASSTAISSPSATPRCCRRPGIRR